MKTSTVYNSNISKLGMGDVVKLEQHAAEFTVAWTEGSADNSVMYVTDSTGETRTLATYRRCFIVRHALRCDCGRRYEFCDQGCAWPAAYELLFKLS